MGMNKRPHLLNDPSNQVHHLQKNNWEKDREKLPKEEGQDKHRGNGHIGSKF